MASPDDTPLLASRRRGLVRPEDLPQWLAELERRHPGQDLDLTVHAEYQSGAIDTETCKVAMMRRGRPQVTRHLSAPPERSGVAVDGPYWILGELGRGAMGSVRFAKDAFLRRKVAYKRIRESVSRDNGIAERFVAEAQITAQLEHPNIVPVYSAHETEDGEIAYAMKLVEGRTLSQFLADVRQSGLDSGVRDEAGGRTNRIELFLRVCDAAAFAHARGVIHRDLKPGNVMIGEFNEVYVMDWGIARLIDGPATDAGGFDWIAPDAPENQTQEGQALGTPRYMAPEQARGDLTSLGPASDQFALGLILQELVTLAPATEVIRLSGAVGVLQEVRPTPFRHVDPRVAVPAELEAIVARATEANPQRRYPDVNAFADDVRAHLRGDPIAALPDNWVRRLARSVVRNARRAVIGILAMGLVAEVSVAASALWISRARSIAVQHERHLTSVQTRAARAAGAIEDELSRYGRLLEGVSAATSILLSESIPSDAKIYLAADLGEPDLSPPDLAASSALGGTVSLNAPTFWLPPGGPMVSRQAGQLVRLRETLFRSMVRSEFRDITSISDQEQRDTLSARGAPITRFRVVLGDETALIYHGQTFSSNTDQRTEGAYLQSAGRRFLHWGDPWRAAEGGLFVTCGRSIYGEDTRTFVGVAMMDVHLGPAIAANLPPEGQDVTGAYLVDRAGRVIARTDGTADLSSDLAPDLRAVLVPGGGVLQRNVAKTEPETVVVTPISPMGWFHVAHFSR